MYKHTQVGSLIFLIVVPVILVMLGLSMIGPAPYKPQVLILSALLLALLILFGTLTVSADSQHVSFRFGVGIIGRSFEYSDITSASKVRNKWYCGWGIRWYGRGWLYNVSGLDAIELKLRNGKQVRIGTDEPDVLLQFITNRIKS